MNTTLTSRHASWLATGLVCLTLSACSSLQEWTNALGVNMPASSNATSAVTELINGNDLNAWKLAGNANWRLHDGLTQALGA